MHGHLNVKLLLAFPSVSINTEPSDHERVNFCEILYFLFSLKFIDMFRFCWKKDKRYVTLYVNCRLYLIFRHP